ncbi:uncharacterized protein LOC100370170 [Saccoglossus kowalevskii]|uniref:Actin cytoskeleton-regulatory complex protein pan1-like n=1 Tax=Saccoglossus kowalevskii TaxID=10224 RepID=A0ABM0GVK9_SACKO|nr:PREDICTED: actin cytoskeleton-regulatory complex protein pan1-like [Saccoglossus kowalevskii]
MKILVAVFVVAVIGMVMAEDYSKDSKQPMAASVTDLKKSHPIRPIEKARKMAHKATQVKLRPEIEEKRRMMRERKEEIMSIKKSDLPLEEKRAKMANLKAEFKQQKMSLGLEGGRKTPEERRAMVQERKLARQNHEEKAIRRMPKIGQRRKETGNEAR